MQAEYWKYLQFKVDCGNLTAVLSQYTSEDFFSFNVIALPMPTS